MNKTALITGASGGIGLELAKVHAATKGDLILIARRTSKLEEIKSEIEASYGVSVLVLPKDLSIPEAPQEIYDTLSEKGIQVDYLINNAGFGDYGKYEETSWEKEEMMINLNILALTQFTKLFGTDMVNRKAGRIMNLSSTAAFLPSPLMTVYFATKHYVQAYSEGLYEEWKGYGVTVTALCPGPTSSGFLEAAEAEGVKLFESRNLPSAQEVAKFGYEAMMRGEMNAIHGRLNSIMSHSIKFMPKKMTLKVMKKLQKK